MIAIQPKQAEFDQKTLLQAVGVDNGHGLLKVVVDNDSRQLKVRCPSKFKEIREDCRIIPHQNTVVHSTIVTGMLKR